MDSNKGLSQVLSLIVAASVLMMTALLVIMFTSGSLTGFFNDIGGSSCTTSIQAQCNSGASRADAPSSCFQEGDSSNRLKTGINYDIGPDNTVACDQVN